jgi:hypothetical protein
LSGPQRRDGRLELPKLVPGLTRKMMMKMKMKMQDTVPELELELKK